jgi:uncharacterized protein
MSWIAAQLRKKEWSPYAAGVLLGVVATLTIWIPNQLLGASGTFESLAGMLQRAVYPTGADNVYFKFVVPPGLTWQMWLVLGTFAGALLSALASRDFKVRWMPDVQWAQVFGPSRWKRWLVAFAGGIILEFGAGIAGGCTSGLAISGGLLLAPAAFLFMAGMFMSGIPTAMIMYRRKY